MSRIRALIVAAILTAAVVLAGAPAQAGQCVDVDLTPCLPRCGHDLPNSISAWCSL